MSSPNFYGSNTALVTPFAQDGSVDEKAFADFINWQIEQTVINCPQCGLSIVGDNRRETGFGQVVSLKIERSMKPFVNTA